MAQTMKFSTFNCQGIGNCSKRRAIFKWLKHFHRDVVLLQETHSVEEHESNWKKDWKGDIYFNHGSTNPWRKSKGNHQIDGLFYLVLIYAHLI